MLNFVQKIASGLMSEQTYERLRAEGPKRYFFHTGWNLLGRAVSLVVSFFVSIYVTRALGPSNWGLLSYVVSFTGIFAFVASLGVDNILYVDLVKEPEKYNKFLGSSFVLKFLGGCLAFFLVLIISVLSDNNFYTNVLLAVVAAGFFFQPFNVINLYFQAKVQSKPTVILSLGLNFLLAAIKILMVFFGLSLKYFAALYLVEAIFSALGYIYIYTRSGKAVSNWGFDFGICKQILSASWPLIISSAFAYVYSRIDQVMIKHLLSQESVGLYDIGVRLSEVWYVFPTIIIGSLTPAIINAKKVSEELYEKRISKLYGFTTYLSLLFILPIAFLATPLIRLLYGNAFLPAAGVLEIYVWAGVSVVWATIVNQYLTNEKLTKISLFLNTFGMVVNVAINWYAIPKFGIIGAAWATLISYSLIPFGAVLFKQSRSQLKYIAKGILLKF